MVDGEIRFPKSYSCTGRREAKYVNCAIRGSSHPRNSLGRATLYRSFFTQQTSEIDVPLVACANCEIHTIIRFSYCETLRKLMRTTQNRRRGQLTVDVTLLHENARTDVSFQAHELLTQFRWTVMPRPPYNPDFALRNYRQLPKLKEPMGGQCFQSDDNVKDKVKRFLNRLPLKIYDTGLWK